MYDFYKNRKKSDYIIDTGRSKMLDSGLFENQVWGTLHKAWKGYVIAKNKDEFDKMLHYADIIQECQDDLGLEASSFHDIGKSALAFYSSRAAQIAEENKSNCNNQEQQVAEEENYLSDHQYVQETFTHILSILEMIIMKLIGSLMIMPIVKILQINQTDLFRIIIKTK
jgi:hypothetical protein